mgnify:CR=1 FL=1
MIDSRERVYFSHTNPGTGGRLLTDLGTPDGSSVIELANGRAMILFEPDDSGTALNAKVEVRLLRGRKLPRQPLDRRLDLAFQG